MGHRVGLLVGASRGFVDALERRLAAEPALACERVLVEAPAERPMVRFDALLDRASERVAHLAAFARSASLAGATVVNDPMLPRDGFFALGRAARLGMATARAVLLPQKAYRSDVDCDRGLNNLAFPLPWQQLVDYVGTPARLVDIETGDEWEPVADVAGLLRAYDGSGERVMMLREHLEGPRVRVICIGDHALSSSDGGDEAALCAQALSLSRALGLAINAVEFAVVGGRAVVVRADHRFVSLEPQALGEAAFDTAVGWATELMARAARSGLAA